MSLQQSMTDRPASAHETVGLLFVHGIGEQEPFEHLTRSVSEIAELLKRDGKTACTVVDRTTGWKAAPGAPTAMGDAPVTLHVKSGTHTTSFECHEVYWADLGAREGILDTITFWFWGLGQWAAPIYREFDAAQLDKSDVAADGKTKLNRQASALARLPKSVAGDPLAEIHARWQLALAGLAALLTLVSWSLLKRIGAALLKTAPSPSTLVQYVGDVRTYEEGARPGDTALSDPGFPRRVGIRRRMVSQMVAMGNRAARGEYDRWYVLGHSLGSVLAYNGLTEIGHTLPNYLGREQWDALDVSLKDDDGCAKRSEDELPFMMPARPPWLKYDEVINRRLLFQKLSGILTYGSPLNKFAALWPRIVATATDRLDRVSVFPPAQACRWINMRAPLDPVAGNLDRYGARNMGPSTPVQSDGSFTTPASAPLMTPAFTGFVPSPETYTTPFWQPYLKAHLDYLRNQSVFARGYSIEHRSQLARWLIRPEQTIAAIAPLTGWQKLGMAVFALVIVSSLLLLTTFMIMPALRYGWSLLAAEQPDALTLGAPLVIFGLVLVIALGVLLFAGLMRWRKDSLFNRKVAKAMVQKDQLLPGLRQTNPVASENAQQLHLHIRQFIAANALLTLLFAPVMITLLLWLSGQLVVLEHSPWSWLVRLPTIGGYIALLGLLAIVVQALVNTTIDPLRPKSDS